MHYGRIPVFVSGETIVAASGTLERLFAGDAEFTGYNRNKINNKAVEG